MIEPQYQLHLECGFRLLIHALSDVLVTGTWQVEFRIAPRRPIPDVELAQVRCTLELDRPIRMLAADGEQDPIEVAVGVLAYGGQLLARRLVGADEDHRTDQLDSGTGSSIEDLLVQEPGRFFPLGVQYIWLLEKGRLLSLNATAAAALDQDYPTADAPALHWYLS